MKVRVLYTYEIAGDDLKALEAYHCEKVTRDSLRQMLIDLGKGGIEEQIMTGYERLKGRDDAALP